MIFIVDEDASGERLDVFLSRVIGDATRSRIQGLNRRGRIRIGGTVCKSGHRLRAGDRVEVELPPVEPSGLLAEAIPLEVIYEDAHLVVVDKPAGMVVHPGAGNRRGTLVNALLARYQNLAGGSGPDRPGIVHRLDKLTSGLMIVARTNEAHAALTKAFRERRVEKTYRGVVHGRPRDQEGEIALPIGRHPRVRTRMTVRKVGGRAASSHYRVLGRAPHFSLLDVSIRTGRTHQIRVHLSAIGHPVVGDPVYGEKFHAAFVRRYGEPGRYFLHAARLGLDHPATGQALLFESPLPAELAELWERLAGDR
jgi:23S rRNA pseudouridine1911/1915/1917 synthase